MTKKVLTPLDIKGDCEKIREYLISYYKKKLGEKAVDIALSKLESKIGKKLGLDAFSFLRANLPGQKLAEFTCFFLKILYFEGFFSLYQNDSWNPYNPIEQEDQYVEYLLYSWARGKPGYIYWLSP